MVFDALDIDLVIKVLQNTAFSPFFTFFIPVIYVSQGQGWDAPVIRWSAAWFLLMTAFWTLKFASRLWRNGGNWFYQAARVSWEDQIVLITGGSSGVGELLANTLAVRNVTVVVLDINPIVSENYNINFYKCDVSKWEEVEVISKKIVEEVGHPTIIVNNAGVVQGKSVIDLTAEDVRQTFDTNVLAHFWTLKAFLPEMIKEKIGHVVTVSSVLGFAGAARVADYSASKFALVGLHESLRYELDKVYKTPKIRTTLLAQGFVQTPMFSRSGFNSRTPSSPLPAWLFRFLAPPLASHDVVKAIIAALDDHESREIYLPFFVHFSTLSRALPSWARDFMQWISGADYVMDGFEKVSGRRKSEGQATSLRTNGSAKHEAKEE